MILYCHQVLQKLSNFSKMVVVSIFFVGLLLRLQFATPASNRIPLGAFVANEDKPPNLNFQVNLENLLDTFTLQAPKIGFQNSTFGESPDQVYGLYLCRVDIDNQGCSNCVSYVKDAILGVTDGNLGHCNNIKWRNYREAVIWYDHCMIRYSRESFFGEIEETTGCAGTWYQDHGTCNVIRFAEVVGDTVNNLAAQVVNNESGKRFATRVVKITSSESLYAIGQCTWDLTLSDCHKCLTKAIGELMLKNDYRGSGGMALQPSCMVWYETISVYNNTTTLQSSSLPSLALSV